MGWIKHWHDVRFIVKVYYLSQASGDVMTDQ